MARQRDPSPTPGELEILNHLWDSGGSELKTICTAIRADRPIATTTVATMLKLMMQKGLVLRISGARGYLWKAKLSRAAAKKGLVGRLLDAAFAGSAHGLISHLIEDGQVSEAERAEIEHLLRKHRTEAPQ